MSIEERDFLSEVKKGDVFCSIKAAQEGLIVEVEVVCVMEKAIICRYKYFGEISIGADCFLDTFMKLSEARQHAIESLELLIVAKTDSLNQAKKQLCKLRGV